MFKPLLGKCLGRKKAQVAIMILFFIALALIFYAVTLNAGRMAQTKTVVTVAANIGAGVLGSHIISYCTQQWKTYLGGNPKFEKCGLTGVFSALIGVIIAIIGLALAIFTGGGSITLCVIGVILAGGGLALQAGPITTMTTNGWEKAMQDILTDEQRYKEKAIQAALQNAATDPKMIPDWLDLNANGKFVGSPKGEDEVSRFAYLYNKRIQDMSPKGYQDALAYVESVIEFVYEGNDGWGLIDGAGPGCTYGVGDSFIINSDGTTVPSECNHCCMPKEIVDLDPDDNPNTPETETYPMRAESCDPLDPSDPNYVDYGPGVTAGTCDAATLYSGYPYVFDVSYSDPSNTFRGWLEKYGKDDEVEGVNRRFFEAVLDEDGVMNEQKLDLDADGAPDEIPQNYYDRYGHPNQIPQRGMGLHTGPSPFYHADVSGYYKEDRETGVFPFFWQAKHFGLDLNTLTKLDRRYPEVLWCDWDNPFNRIKAPDGSDSDSTPTINENTSNDGNSANPYNDYVDPDPDVDFDGDGDPTNDIYALKCVKAYEDMVVMNEDETNGKQRVEQLDLGEMEDIQVDVPIAAGYLVDILYGTNNFVDGPAFSKQDQPPVGLDKVNETSAKYVALMGLHGDPKLDTWREGAPFYCHQSWPYDENCYDHWEQMDMMDWVSRALKNYLKWAIMLGSNREYAANQLYNHNWQADLKHWRSWLTTVSQTINNALLPRLREWKDETYVTPGCEGVGAAWCIPGDPSQCSSPVPPEEEATFGDGKIEDVAACLEWNSQFDPNIDPDPAYAGNAAKFKRCLTECTADACTDLPRSLVPGFNPNVNPGSFDGNCDPNDTDNTWAQNMVQSIAEAQKQGIKMAMRAKFLRSLIYRRDQLIDVLQEGADKITAFLNAPDPNYTVPVSDVLYYGWQDDANEDLGIVQGPWHFVKVEATFNEHMPWVRTWTKGFLNSKRCYGMTNDSGRAQIRVTRFDRPFSPSDEEKIKVKFGEAGSTKMLWKFWTYNPLDAFGLASVNLTGIPDTCKNANAYAKDINGEFVEGAFITSDNSGGACTEIVETTMKYGVTACTAIVYGRQVTQNTITYDPFGNPTIHNGAANKGYSFNFADCQ